MTAPTKPLNFHRLFVIIVVLMVTCAAALFALMWKPIALFMLLILGGLGITIWFVQVMEPSCSEVSKESDLTEYKAKTDSVQTQTSKKNRGTTNNFSFSFYFLNPEKHQDKAGDGDGNKHWSQKGWWKKFFCELKVGDAAIVFFTYCLVIVGAFQAWYLIDAGETALASANAAKESADGIKDQARVAIKARLPVVGWAGAKLVDVPTVLREYGLPEEKRDPVPAGPPPVVSEPLVLLKNAGPTNIAVSFLRFKWIVATALPRDPFYDGMIPTGYFMEVMAQWVTTKEYIIITEEEMADIEAGRRYLWLYGFCRYDDFLDEWNIIRFCYRWDLKEGFVRGPDGPYWETERQKRY